MSPFSATTADAPHRAMFSGGPLMTLFATVSITCTVPQAGPLAPSPIHQLLRLLLLLLLLLPLLLLLLLPAKLTTIPEAVGAIDAVVLPVAPPMM